MSVDLSSLLKLRGAISRYKVDEIDLDIREHRVAIHTMMSHAYDTMMSKAVEFIKKPDLNVRGFYHSNMNGSRIGIFLTDHNIPRQLLKFHNLARIDTVHSPFHDIWVRHSQEMSEMGLKMILVSESLIELEPK